MKRFYQMGLIVAVISVLSFVSCGVHSKNSYLKEFKSFVDKVENTDFDTEAEWNEALKEYERFTTTYYEEYKDKLWRFYISENRYVSVKINFNLLNL